jgi:integrase
MTTVAPNKRGLTPKVIATLAQAKQQGQWTHTKGLVFAVAKSGTAFWAFRYQTLDGNRRLFTLCQYDGIDTAKLRSLEYQAYDLRKQVKAGRDPIAEKAIKVAATNNGHAQTFEDVARAYIEHRKTDWKINGKSHLGWTNSLTTYAYPIIGRLAPHAITTVDVLKVLQQPHHGKNSAGPFWNNCRETANRVRNRIELILSSAKAKGLSDPATKGLWQHSNAAAWDDNLKHLLSGKRRTKTNFAAIDWKLAPEFMHDLKQRTGFAANALELTILCAVRTSQTIGAPWSEFDLDNALWTVPAERMKATNEHRIPLSDAAVQLLRKLPRMHQNPFVFAGVKQGCGLHNMAMLQCLHTLRTGLTVHGFRSTFKDWTEDSTLHPAAIVETALAHSEKDKTVAAYRRSDALERRRILMQHWSDYLLMTDRDAYSERWAQFIAI